MIITARSYAIVPDLISCLNRTTYKVGIFAVKVIILVLYVLENQDNFLSLCRMFRIERLLEELLILKYPMAKNGMGSKHSLHAAHTERKAMDAGDKIGSGDKKAEIRETKLEEKLKKRESDTKWHRLFNLRRSPRCKSQSNGLRKKISPSSNRNCIHAKSEIEQLTTSEVIINVLGSDSEEDCGRYCESDLNSSNTECNSNNENIKDRNIGQRTRTRKTSVFEANETQSAFSKPAHQSTFDEKITPIGRLLVPLRGEGEGEFGFNSLFISPETPFETESNTEDSGNSRFSKLRKWLEPAENPVNLKIFGGNRGLAKEQHRMKSAGFLIHPYSIFRFVQIHVYFILSFICSLVCLI